MLSQKYLPGFIHVLQKCALRDAHLHVWFRILLLRNSYLRRLPLPALQRHLYRPPNHLVCRVRLGVRQDVIAQTTQTLQNWPRGCILQQVGLLALVLLRCVVRHTALLPCLLHIGHFNLLQRYAWLFANRRLVRLRNNRLCRQPQGAC